VFQSQKVAQNDDIASGVGYDPPDGSRDLDLGFLVPLPSGFNPVVVHLSDHNRVMVAQVDYYIRAYHSINGKGKLRYLTKLFIL